MAEENLLTIKAQVYYLDQASQNWSPATFTVIPVGFWYEAPPAHRTRIIGLENNEVRVNSIVSPGMTFSRMSETFGQWHDPITSQFYGLNFMSTSDTEQFERFFIDATEDRRPGTEGDGGAAPSAAPSAAGGAVAAASAGGAGGSSAEAEVLREKVAELTKRLAEKDAELVRKLNEKEQQMEGSQSALQAQLNALKADNESLKTQITALKSEASKSAGSSDMVKKLSDEVAKLKKAMIENAQNVDAWKRQITEYETENGALHAKVAQLNEAQKQVAAILGPR